MSDPDLKKVLIGVTISFLMVVLAFAPVKVPAGTPEGKSPTSTRQAVLP